MAEANATIVGSHPHGESMANDANTKGFSRHIDPSLYRKPEYFVYVFSVVDPRPAGHPLIRDIPPLIKSMRIPECPIDKPYVMVTKIPHPVNQPGFDPMSGQRTAYYTDAKLVAMDIVNPANPSYNQDAQLRPEHESFYEGQDYGKLGVFWSMNEVPTDEEVLKAIQRKENHYRSILTAARGLEISNPGQLNAMLTITHHVAADYFGEEYSWHRKQAKPTPCPNCGEKINPGAKFHQSTALGGILCVIDWKAAVEAGVKTYDQVPDEKKWRKPGRPPKEASE